MEKNIKDLLVVYMEEKKKILSNEKDEKVKIHIKIIALQIDNQPNSKKKHLSRRKRKNQYFLRHLAFHS